MFPYINVDLFKYSITGCVDIGGKKAQMPNMIKQPYKYYIYIYLY